MWYVKLGCVDLTIAQALIPLDHQSILPQQRLGLVVLTSLYGNWQQPPTYIILALSA